MLVESFLRYIRYEKNLSTHTVLSYKGDLFQFKEFLENNNIPFVGNSSKSCKEGFDKVKATDKLSKSGFFMFPSM